MNIWEGEVCLLQLARKLQTGDFSTLPPADFSFPCFSWCSRMKLWCCSDCWLWKTGVGHGWNKKLFLLPQNKSHGAHRAKPDCLSWFASEDSNVLAKLSLGDSAESQQSQRAKVAWALLKMLSCNVILKDQNLKLATPAEMKLPLHANLLSNHFCSRPSSVVVRRNLSYFSCWKLYNKGQNLVKLTGVVVSAELISPWINLASSKIESNLFWSIWHWQRCWTPQSVLM